MDSRTEFCRTFSRILIFNGQNLIGYWVLGNGCELGNGYVLGINLPSNQVIKHSYQSLTLVNQPILSVTGG